MEFITLPQHAAQWSAQVRAKGGKVGFVPTMGALHEGHLDLIHRAKASCEQVVCSIFVNPLQFNNLQDLERYPRQPEQDRALLEQAGCNALFFPSGETLFADHTSSTYDLGGLDRSWEGPSRPGHFQGVVNVVERLFFYVRPDKAFFGEKDRQQLAIIKHAAGVLHWPEEIVACPTVRAADGLALSSRNQRLSEDQRASATVLYRALQKAQEMAFRHPVLDVHQAVRGLLERVPDVELDHFGIAHPLTLEPLEDWSGTDQAVALIAAQVGAVRLIDNLTLVR